MLALLFIALPDMIPADCMKVLAVRLLTTKSCMPPTLAMFKLPLTVKLPARNRLPLMLAPPCTCRAPVPWLVAAVLLVMTTLPPNVLLPLTVAVLPTRLPAVTLPLIAAVFPIKILAVTALITVMLPLITAELAIVISLADKRLATAILLDSSVALLLLQTRLLLSPLKVLPMPANCMVY